MSQQTKNYTQRDSQENILKTLKFERTKNSEPYIPMFFRNQHEIAEADPSPPTQANISRTKSRLKSTRVKSKGQACIYYELEQTKKNEIEVLKQENGDLKEIIAELKLSQMYQINQIKVKELLMEVEELRESLSRIQKENLNLKLENDILSRTNFKLKHENDSLSKKAEKFRPASPDIKFNTQHKLVEDKITTFESYSNEESSIPEYLLLGDNAASIRSSRHKFEMNLPKDRTDLNTIKGMKISSEEIPMISKVKSEELLGCLESRPRRKTSNKKTVKKEIGSSLITLE